jgi:uncharacterized protein YjbI with pentapeptide repeats
LGEDLTNVDFSHLAVWQADLRGVMFAALDFTNADLTHTEAAQAQDYSPERGQTNPFLHLSMHLAISEQLSIDQPPGIRAAHERLAARLGSTHEAQHAIMDCLGETIWEAQRTGTPPDTDAYLQRIERRATRD